MSRIIEKSNAEYDDLVFQFELLKKLHDQTIKEHDYSIIQYEYQLNDTIKSYENKLQLLGLYSFQTMKIKEVIETNEQLCLSNNELTKKCKILQDVNSEASSSIIELERKIESIQLDNSATITNLREKITSLQDRITKLRNQIKNMES